MCWPHTSTCLRHRRDSSHIAVYSAVVPLGMCLNADEPSSLPQIVPSRTPIQPVPVLCCPTTSIHVSRKTIRKQPNCVFLPPECDVLRPSRHPFRGDLSVAARQAASVQTTIPHHMTIHLNHPGPNARNPHHRQGPARCRRPSDGHGCPSRCTWSGCGRDLRPSGQ